MQLDYLINELTRLRNFLPPESNIRIGVDGYSNHTYVLNEIRFTPIEPLVELEHTCGQGHTCNEYGELDCPVCDCPGCTDESETEAVTIYFIEGDQDPYSLPETIDEDELKLRLGEN